MLTVILVIIYLAFISLGLPDAAFGAAWPEMYGVLGVSVSAAGIFSVLSAGGTIVSSSLSGKLIARFGTARVTAVSAMMTACGLLGLSVAPGFRWIVLLALPLGLGAGSVDAALNGFVALHYGARHMNWLHCFWGLGATLGPLIMSRFLAGSSGWRGGFLTLGIIQASLTVLLFATLPLWKRVEKPALSEETKKADVSFSALLALPGAKPAMAAFFCYCAAEQAVGLWSSSYLVISGGLDSQRAARFAAMFYLGITFGRFAAGFVAEKLGNKTIIRIGQCVSLCGALMLTLRFSPWLLFAGLMLFGIGCAPVYPAMLHETPRRFGEDKAQGIMGLQMAVAYTGSTLMPPVTGWLCKTLSFGLFPFIALVLTAAMLLTSEAANRKFKRIAIN